MEIEPESDLLEMRRFRPADLDELAKIGADPETRGFAWTGATDRKTTAYYLEAWMEEYERGLGHLAMIYKPDKKLVGHCGLSERDGHVVLSYALHKDYWCKGLAPQACWTVLSYGFKEVGVEEIRTATHPENRAWRSMMEKKLGMTLRETRRTATGEEVHYAVSKEEFLARGK